MNEIVLPIIRHFKDRKTVTELKPHESWIMPEPNMLGGEYEEYDSEDEENWEYLV